MSIITNVHAREILDSRGNPTIEVEVETASGFVGRAMVPSGASTGEREALELRDNDAKRYLGKGVLQAVENVNNILIDVVLGMDVTNQAAIDQALIEADGTKDKSKYGANAILGISLAVAHAAAAYYGLPLYRYLGGINAKTLPVPMMNVLNGGSHADSSVDFQEFMIMPVGAKNFREGLRMCAEIYQVLKGLLKKAGLETAVGDEGGFAPNLQGAREALLFLKNAVEEAGYEMGKDIKIALDAAASELYHPDTKQYYFPGESKMTGQKVTRTAEEMIDYYQELALEFPISSIEDPLDEEDWDGWELLTTRLGSELQLVGDDLFVTNTKRLKKGIERNAANAILVKVNQIGTLTEAIEAIELAQKSGYHVIISHRSGETEDTTIADLAVAFNTGQIKTGAPCRGERVAKYNQLLRIEETLR